MLELVVVLVFVGLLVVGLVALPLVVSMLQQNHEEETKKKTSMAPFDSGIRELIREGKKDEALKAYQTFTDMSEEDAKIEIERLEWEEIQSRENRA
jgi:NADH:ubiquinone oxidoreductase subunit 3 (subunit A)